jgi:hypothetical protein
MTNIKEEDSNSNVLKVHFYVEDNILMDPSESMLSSYKLTTSEISDLKANYVVCEGEHCFLSSLLFQKTNPYCIFNIPRSF